MLAEEVLFEILRKPRFPGVEVIAKKDAPVKGAFTVFAGGLWEDTCSMNNETLAFERWRHGFYIHHST